MEAWLQLRGSVRSPLLDCTLSTHYSYRPYTISSSLLKQSAAGFFCESHGEELIKWDTTQKHKDMVYITQQGTYATIATYYMTS